MLNIIKAIIFGIIEGVTEWLPISSTGHLILAKAFMSFTNVSENFWNVFEVIIQLGAILAVIIMYFKNIWPIKVEKNKHSGGSCLKWDKSILRLWAKIIVACLPAVAIAILKIRCAPFESPNVILSEISFETAFGTPIDEIVNNNA